MTATTLSPALKGGALILLLVLIYTGVYTGDRITWLMEVTPVGIVVPLLLATHQRYPLTPLLYILIFFHALILMVGGMYTYAKVPIGFEVQALFDLSRNPYDKLGHFFQAMGQGADDFLGTQGDPWDTQSDMFCALLGALTTVLLLGRTHQRQLMRTVKP